LTAVADEARAAGATTHTISCDLARLADVRDAGRTVAGLLDSGAVRPLRAVVGNAGLMSADTHTASADGYELTFAVNYLAHAQLINDHLGVLTAPARVVLVGSNTYHQNIFRRILKVPPADWHNPIQIAQPTATSLPATFAGSGTAYSNSKLALLYYAHELQRRVSAGINVAVFEPGFMPGTGISRHAGPGVARIGRIIAAIPGVSTPTRSGPALASVVLDERWAHLRDGAFVVKSAEREVKPFAIDRGREAGLWEATAQLLDFVR
jgi:NAD(P)-dependent dehydrogenase (short-subunit alcohol dehydrogenase family)